MVYGAETWAVKKAEEGKMDVTQMRLLSNEDGENKKRDDQDNESWRDLKESTGKRATVLRPRTEESRGV